MQAVLLYIRHLSVRGGGEKLCLALAAALAQDSGRSVTVLTQEQVDPDVLSKYFDVDLSRVRFVHAQAGPILARLHTNPRVPGLVRNVADEVVAARALRTMPCDIFVNHTHQSYLANPASRGVLLCMFPNPLNLVSRTLSIPRRVYYWLATRAIRRLLHPGYRSAVDSYDTVLAISEYTASWIDRLWGRSSEVLYPICGSMSESGRSREKVILHVGRFFPDFSEAHHKKQDWLLERFLDMPDLIEQGWQLHFVGGVLDDPISRGYVDGLRERADGAPVYFHTDVAFDELRDLYNRAAVYWHATGYGHDADTHPEKHEHFGISTVEAMSTGCLPIVIDSAGQREIVHDGVDGYLWSTPDQLAERTRAVALAVTSDDSTLARMRDAAIERAHDFDQPSFDQRVRELFPSPVDP